MHYINAPRLFDGEQFHQGLALITDGENIAGLCKKQDIPQGANVTNFKQGTLAPGFIDVQVNGGGGVMLNNTPTADGVDLITKGHRRAGTTSVMPTVISDSPSQQRRAVEAVAQAQQRGNAGVLGVHIEGPFFDLDKRGIHQPTMIRSMSADDIAWLCSLKPLTVILTLAPEHCSTSDIQTLSEAGLYICAGHTNASYEQVEAALSAGLRGFTHLFNAMSPMESRAPGTVGAALDDRNSWVGVIADGHHVHPASVRIAHRAKAAGKIMLVSDSMSTIGTDDTSVEVYGEIITVRDGALVNAEGSLAGSAIGLNDAVRYSHRTVGLPLEECLRMASLYPAQFLQREQQLGRLKENYRADMVLFDDDINVLATWLAGQQQSYL